MPPWPACARRLVYFGTPAMAVAPLRALHHAGYEIVLVVTGEPRRRRRAAAPEPSAVARAAAVLGIPVAHRPGDAAAVAGDADGAVVVAYGRLIGPDVLDVLPALNVHFSALPRWRGAAPLERAILAGDETTGVCLMALEPTLDTGPVYERRETPIGPDETLEELRGRLVALGCDLLVGSLSRGPGEPVPQRGEVTWAARITEQDLRLDWSRPAAELHRRVRLGRAWTTLGGERLRVRRAEVTGAAAGPPGTLDGLVVATGEGGLRLLEVQAAGRRALAAEDWRRGARPGPVTVLGT